MRIARYRAKSVVYFGSSIVLFVLGGACDEDQDSNALDLRADRSRAEALSAAIVDEGQSILLARFKKDPGAKMAGWRKGASIPMKQTFELELGLPDRWNLDQGAIRAENLLSWKDVTLERLVVRLPGNEQHSVVRETRVDRSRIPYRFDRPGISEFVFCTETSVDPSMDSSDRRSKSTVYCNKTVVRVADFDGHVPNNIGPINEKSGDRIEVRPMMPLESMAIGSEMTVRCYIDSETLKGETVQAISPDGRIVVRETEANGYANFKFDRAGVWTIRYRTQKDGREFVGDLVFPVLSKQPPNSTSGSRFGLPASRNGATTDGWVELGPAPYSSRGTGRVSAIAPHPEVDDLYYLGAATGGVWECKSGKCKVLTKRLPSASVGAVTVDPHDPKIIYGGSGEPTYRRASFYGAGIYKSIDAGATWKVLAADQFLGRTVSRIVVSPEDQNVLWATVMRATRTNSHPGADHPDVGLFKSTDAGETWALVSGLPKIVASDLVLDPKDSNIMYLGLAANNQTGGFYKSTDGGKTWEEKTQGLGRSLGVIEISVSPTMTSRIYLVTSNNGRTKVYISSDAGESWEEHTPEGLRNWEWYCVSIAVDPSDPDTAVVGGIQAFRTTDAGRSYQKVSSMHPDNQAFVYDRQGNLLSGNDGGFLTSPDNGRSWKGLNDGLGIVQFYPGFSTRSDDPGYFIAGTQDNGTLRLKNGKWSMVLGGDGGTTAIHPDKPNIVFASIYGTGSIHRSRNGGDRFSKVQNGLSGRTPWMAEFVFDPNDSDTIFYGTQKLWKSSNLGDSWSDISENLAGNNGSIVNISIAPGDSKVMYVSTTNGRFLASEDGGKTFDLKLENLKAPWTAHDHVRVAPWDPKTVYLGVPHFGEEQIRVSRDGGDTWKVLDGNLMDSPVNSLEVIGSKNPSQFLLVGTDHGLHISCNEDEKWYPVGGPLEDSHVWEIRYEEDRERLVVMTFGRGAWIYEGANEEWLLELCEEDDDTDTDTDSETGTESATDSDSDSSTSDDDSGDSTSSEEDSDTSGESSSDAAEDESDVGEDSSGSSDSTTGEASSGDSGESAGEGSDLEETSEDSNTSDGSASSSDSSEGGCACRTQRRGSSTFTVLVVFLVAGFRLSSRKKAS